VLSFLALLFLSRLVGLAEAQTDDRYTIRFQSREFSPAPGLDLADLKARISDQQLDRVHLLVQFYDLPNTEAQRRLADQGLSLLAYVSGNSYIASVPSADLDSLSAVSGLPVGRPPGAYG